MSRCFPTLGPLLEGRLSADFRVKHLKDVKEQCMCKSVDESLKDVCAIHESLKANQDVFISKTLPLSQFLQMVPAGPAFALDVGLRAPYCWGPTVLTLVASRSS